MDFVRFHHMSSHAVCNQTMWNSFGEKLISGETRSLIVWTSLQAENGI